MYLSPELEKDALFSIHLADEQAMQRFGQQLAHFLKAGDCLGLSGDLGAGKSTLARAIIQAKCDVDDVPSPTFTFVQTYDGCTGDEIWHFDFYRLDDAQDAYELGIEEAFDDGLCLMEWPEKLGQLAPPHMAWLVIEKEDAGRRLALFGPENDFGWSEKAQALKDAGA